MNKYQTYCGVFLTLFLGSNLSLAAEPTPVSPSHATESSSVEILSPKTAHQPNAGHYTPAKATPVQIISAAEHREAVKAIEEAQAAVASDPKLLDEYQPSSTLFFILLALTVVGLAGVYCWHHFGYLNRMTIKPKLYVGMGLLLSLTSAIGFQGVLFEGTLKKYAASATSAAEIEFLAEKAARTEFEFRTVSHADTETQEKLTASFHEYTNAIHSDLGELIDHETDVKVAEILSHVQELTTAYQAGFSEYARASSDIHSTQLRIKSVSKEYLEQLETTIAQLEVFHHEFASNNQDHLVPLLELIAAVEGVEISWMKSINEVSNFAFDQDFAHVQQLEKNLGEMVAKISDTEHLLTRFSSLPIDQNEVRDVLSNGLTNAAAIAQDCRNLFQLQKSNMALAIVNKGTVHKVEAETASVLGYKNQRVAATSATSKNVSYLLIGSAVLIGLMISIVLSDSVIKPIRLLLERLRSLADGDLTQTIKVDRGDEFGKLAKAYNDAVGQLHSMVSDVSGAAHEVAGAATQIAATSEEMARGLDNQQQQTNESSAAVEELSSSIASVSDKSCHAAEAANNSGNEAIEGGKVVAETVHEIQGIAEQVRQSVQAVDALGVKSEAIGEIIAVINDIADQTNLLALNAAIEAARAGEHGRGFAVVADEVRKLAERTTTATEQVSKSIREIQDDTKSAISQIEQGSSRVEKGVEMASKAGGSLDRIVEASKTLQAMVDDIASAVEEQSVGAQQIAESTSRIVQVTRESSSAASEANSAASNLSHQAESLLSMTSRFNV